MASRTRLRSGTTSTRTADVTGLDKIYLRAHNTTMDKQIEKLVDGMVANGVPRTQAVAVALSIEHSIGDVNFARAYGTFMVAALQEFLKTAAPQ